MYLHRASFRADLFAGLSGPEAEAAYNRAVDRLASELRARRVAEADIQLMTSTPSTSLVKVASDHPTASPWLDEWLSAKCGSERSPGGALGRTLICETDAILAEQRRSQGKD